MHNAIQSKLKLGRSAGGTMMQATHWWNKLVQLSQTGQTRTKNHELAKKHGTLPHCAEGQFVQFLGIKETEIWEIWVFADSQD
jgi:hypothetical protein